MSGLRFNTSETPRRVKFMNHDEASDSGVAVFEDAEGDLYLCCDEGWVDEALVYWPAADVGAIAFPVVARRDIKTISVVPDA